jgi:hypothetical protein
MSSKNQSRSETNRELRRIFVRHGVDTSSLQFSCSGRTISLSGGLYKDGGKDLSVSNVETIFQEITRLGLHMYCELENWTVTEGMISKKGGHSQSDNKGAASNNSSSNSPNNTKAA